MSKEKHPLFLTRGVPGTHDLVFLNKIISKLKKKNFKTVIIPKFDKSKDDRSKKNKWQKIKIKPDIIIFEGWCVGAISQKKNKLKKPLNYIEQYYDQDLRWRKMVNNYLKNQYKVLFDKIDKLVYLKAPNFNYIFRWRLLQEQKLKMKSKNKNIMSKEKIREFIMFYERITRDMMNNFSQISDLTIFLDKHHRSKKMKFF